MLTLAILAPAAGAVAWFLAANVRHAREAADGKVSILASDASARVQGYLDRTRATLERLAARPLVQALDARSCDPLIAELVKLSPEFATLIVRDLQGRAVCSPIPNPLQQINEQDFPWFGEILRSGRFVAGDANKRPQSGRWVTVLSQPIHDASGRMTGLLALPVDLLSLGELLLSAVPKDAVVSVLDRQRVVLLRSSDAATFVGKGPRLDQPDPALGLREGWLTAAGRDGVERRYAVTTLPDIGWRVVAGLPQSLVYAEYESTLTRTLWIGAGLALLALAGAWQLSASIVGPIAGLAQAAAGVAAGDVATRASVAGPTELAVVAQQFNRMLDSHDQGLVALRDSEARYRDLVDWSPQAICVHRDGLLVYVNPAAVTLFGAACAGDLLGKPILQFIHPDFHRPVQQRLLAARDHGAEGAMIEQVLVRLDGRLVDAEVNGHAGHFDGLPAMVASIRDITARKRAEAALRESEANLRRLLERLPEAVVVIRGGRIMFVNDAGQRLLGADAAALVGRAAPELFQPGSLAVDPARILALRAIGSVPHLIEEQILRADGTARVVDTMATLIEDSGGPSILAVMRDVTSLRRAQAALVDSHADLQRLLAAQDSVQEEERKRIARELHDELQQALAVIRMDLGVIARRLNQGPVDLGGVAEMVAAVDARAANVVASTRRIVNDLRPHVLEDLGLEAALEMMTREIGERAGLAYYVEAQPEASEALLQAPAVTTCLYRVAQEALNNVVKHAQASTVWLELMLVGAGRVALRVHDDGKGFSPRQRNRTDSFGLQGMAERVRALSGTLRIDTPLGGGTVIDVTLPLSSAAAVRVEGDRPASAWRQRSGDESYTEARGPDFTSTQGVINALAGNVAVLGPAGVIEYVNQAWSEFAERNGAPGMATCGPGTDYLEVCRRSSLSDPSALIVLQGLMSVLGGSSPNFVSEYPCDAPHEQRWFRLHAASISGGRVLVTHFDLTGWVDRGALDAVGATGLL